MTENVLRIEAKRYREDSVVMSARIPKDMLQDSLRSTTICKGNRKPDM